jgi:putative hydrolase of the HAD superfamily
MERQLFFDLDRTLWDFEANSKKALQQLFADLNLGDRIAHFNHFHHTYVRINSELWLDYGKGRVTKEVLRDSRFSRTLAYHGIDDEDLHRSMSNGYIEISPRQTQLFPGTKEALEELRSAGYRMHIITNGFSEVQHIKLGNCGLASYFEKVLCSEEIGCSKPNCDIFREAERRAGCRPENAVMIGDDLRADILGALGAGWRAIHFDPEHRNRKERTVRRIRQMSELPLAVAMLK